MIPKIAGVSDFQRKGKQILDPLKKGEDEVVFISERNHVFGAMMSIAHYEELLKAAERMENDFWLAASEKSMGFWNDKSNDAYEKYL